MEQTIKELKRRYEWSNSIFQGSGDAMRVIAPDFTVVRVNEEMSRLLGRSSNDNTDVRCYDQFCGEHCFTETCTLRRILKGEKRVKVETVKKSSDGKAIPVEMIATPLVQDGGIAGVIESFRDISRRREREQALLEAKRKAEEANEAKNAFLANMSHEIRTPMNAVIGFSELVLQSDLTQEQQHYLKIINKSSKELLALLHGILECSQFAAGEMVLQENDFDLKRVAREVSEHIRGQLADKPVKMSCQISPGIPDRVRWDRSRFRQALLHMMSNGATFTESGHVLLSLELEEEQADRLKIHLAVQDSGIGVPADKLSLIFEPFQQADGSATRKYGGAGLGLTLCKHIAALAGGQVWAESEVDRGSTFHMTFWCSKATVQEQPDNRHKEHPERKGQQKDTGGNVAGGQHILLAEDNRVNQMMARIVLTQAGYLVTIADNGRQAVNIFSAAPDDFACILMDIQMPEKDGIQAAREIRDKGFTSVPIIALTGNALKGEREKCYQAGMNDFLTKPFDAERVLGVLQKYVD